MLTLIILLSHSLVYANGGGGPPKIIESVISIIEWIGLKNPNRNNFYFFKPPKFDPVSDPGVPLNHLPPLSWKR